MIGLIIEEELSRLAMYINWPIASTNSMLFSTFHLCIQNRFEPMLMIFVPVQSTLIDLQCVRPLSNLFPKKKKF